MSVEGVKELFKKAGMGERVHYSDMISDTVENAALAVGCLPAQIAKTMSFLVDGAPIVIVISGDVKIDNAKYKETFSVKAKMIPFDTVEELVGHIPGGICPFACKDGVKVYLDESLRRFDVIYTGGGDEHHTVAVTIPVLEAMSDYTAWVDVCKGR